MKQTNDLPRLLAFFPVTVLPILLPYYGSAALGLSPTALSMLVAAYFAAAVGARLLLIPLADRLGPRRVFLLGLALFLCSDLAFAFSRGFAALCAGRILLAAAVAGVSVASLGSIAAQGGNAGRSLGGLHRSANLGGLLGVALCFAAMQNASLGQGWQRYFLLCALACGAAFLLALAAWHPQPQLCRPAHAAMSDAQRRLAWLNGAASLCTGLLAAPLVLYMEGRFHAGLPAIAAAFLIPLLLCSLAQPALGRLYDRHRRAAPVGLLLGGLSIALAPLFPGVAGFAVAYMLYQACAALLQIGLDASFLRDLPADARGALTARYTACANLGSAAGAALGGVLFQYGVMAAPFIACAAGFLLLFFPVAKA